MQLRNIMFGLVFISITYAQNFQLNTKITGQVVDSITNSPVEYASIVIYKENENKPENGLVTDNQGKFTFDKNMFGKYNIKITFIGYKTHYIKDILLTPAKQNIALGKIQLVPKTFIKSEIEVKGQRALIENHIDKQVVNVEQSPASSGTVIDVLRNTPSVSVDNESNISVRGKTGVIILIDGKPMLSDSKTLEQMPAAMVDKIEVVTAPSVKYDPEGDSGIINIILKKNTGDNYNARVLGKASTKENYNATINTNYRFDSYNIFADFSQFNGLNKGTGEITRTNKVTNGETQYLGKMNNKYNYDSYDLKLGLDYNINDNHSITTYVAYNQRDVNFNQAGSSNNYLNNNLLLNTIDFNVRGKRYNKDSKFSLFYKYKLDDEGHELTSDIFYNYNNGDDNNNSFYNYSYDPLQNIQKTTTKTDNYYLIYKLDYTNPQFYNGKLEAGLSYTYRDKISDYKFFENYQTLDDFSDRNRVSNLFEYIENIGATYLNYMYQIDSSTTLQTGLRYEIVRNNANQKSSQIKFDKNFNDLYPSIYLSRKLNDYNTIKISYNKRVTRPNLWAINPFKTINRLMIQEGNPALKQVYTHNYELTYSFNYFVAYANLTAYYNNSKGNFERFTYMINDSVQYSSWTNLSKQENYGISFGAGSPFAQWLMMNFFVNVFHNKNYGNFYNENLNSEYTSWNFNYFAMIKLPYDIETNISIYYNPGYKSDKVKAPKFTFTYLALKKNFFDKKLNVTLSINDLFKSMKFDYQQYGSNFTNRMYFKPNMGQEISLTLTYNINNFKPIKTRNLDDGRNKENENQGTMGM